jgi:predicted dehydrogenase
MNANPVIGMMGRRLRLGVVGGGPGSFIGATHRQAARMDDRFEIAAGAICSDPDRSRAEGRAIGLPPDRSYGSALELIEAERKRPDAVDAVAIMTPNDSHFEYACAALRAGFDVICDKPMTNTLEDARELHALVLETGLVFCLTHNYTGYPMIRQAREMIRSGMLGTIRLVQVEYVQGGKAREVEPDPKAPRAWRFDPVRGGPSAVMGDIGTHAHNLLRYVTGIEVAALAADIGAVVPGRRVHDFGGALLRLEGGAKGSFWVTQAAAGVENSLGIRASGTLGTIEWNQEVPQKLSFKPLDGPAQALTPNGPGCLPLAARSTRLVKGHPEGFPEAFANIYSDAAEAIAARRSGKAPDPLSGTFPNSADGVAGVRFVRAAIESSAAGGAWVELTGN